MSPSTERVKRVTVLDSVEASGSCFESLLEAIV